MDRKLESIPAPYLNVLVFVLAFAVLVSRRPDAIFNAQFWAEDGKLWYADAYNMGGLRALLHPINYFQSFPRLVAMAVQPFPLKFAPLLFNVVGLVIQTLPVLLLASTRLARLGNLPTRLFLGLVYLALPNTWELHATLTNAFWHLALVVFMVLVGTTPASWAWRTFDVSCTVLTSLTGPFAIMLTPVAALEWWRRREWKSLCLLTTLAAGALIQATTMLYTAHYTRFDRSPQPLGATPALLAKILAGQVFLGALVGANTFYRNGTLAASLVAAVGIVPMVYALLKGPRELKLLIGLAALILAACLVSPFSVVNVPAWQELVQPRIDVRYWFLPMLAFVSTLIWLVGRQRPKGLRFLAAMVLSLMFFGIKMDWPYPALRDLNFPQYAERFEASPPGTVFIIPCNPDERFSMRLVKH